MIAIRIAQIDKFYAKLHALKGIDLEIPAGSFFGLLGPNGAGKSTLINIIAGLVHASRGTVHVMGHDVRKNWRQARRSLGVVPQEIVSDPFFSVRELLQLQSGYFGLGRENRAWLEELLETLNLNHKANENVHHLSGGMKRRMLIAQALVHRPQVVVLDEPTAGVDVELRRVLWKFTQQMHNQGHTILLTTHYLEEAEALCRRIAIVNNGELIALDDTATLLAHYPFRFLCLQLENPPQAIESILPPGLREKVEKYVTPHLTLRLHRQQDSISSVLDALAAAHITFRDLRTDDPNLEDVFIALTSKHTMETDSL